MKKIIVVGGSVVEYSMVAEDASDAMSLINILTCLDYESKEYCDLYHFLEKTINPHMWDGDEDWEEAYWELARIEHEAYYERNIDPTYEVISQLSTLFNTPVHVLLYDHPDPLEHIGLNDPQTEWGAEKFGHLKEEEKIILANLRMLPLNLRQKIIREIEDLKEKNEGN